MKTIEVSFPGGKRVDARIGDRVIMTDQPVESGGEDSAPTPFMLFLASIATCAGVYASEFCHSRKIDTGGMALTASFEYDEAARRYTKVSLFLKLPPGFPDKYRDAIVRAMDSCAVKKHIVNAPAFEIKAG